MVFLTNEEINGIFINERNAWLWQRVNVDDKIKIILWDEDYSEVFTSTDNSPVEIRINRLDINSFNHEICHIHINNIFGGYFPILQAHKPVELDGYISRDCIMHVANCIEHIMFYDLYLEIGGSPKGFISDYNLKKGNNIHNGLYILDYKSIDKYLGNLLSILADKNPNHNYDKELSIFKQVSPKVYEACLQLIDSALRIGIAPQKEDFVIDESGSVVINDTHSNSSYRFWDAVSQNI